MTHSKSGHVPGPLDGLRVLDFTQIFAGPGTGMYLADMGADVIKIEPPDGGRDRIAGALTPTFAVLNRGKRSLVLDIRTGQGRDIVHQLVRRSDVMIVAWPPGQADRLGYDYETIRNVNQRLVYASITGWGERGPLAMMRGYDRLLQAHTGMMAARPAPDGTPLEASFFPADMAIPMLLCHGISLALLVRERTGMGQKVETSQLQAMIAMQSIHLAFAERPVAESGKLGTGWRPPHTYRTRDGRYLVIVPLAENEWVALWQAMDLPELAASNLLRDPAGRTAEFGLIHDALAARFATRPLAHWQEVLSSAVVPHIEVLTREEFVLHPHAWENEMLVNTAHPEAGQITMMGLPLYLSATPGKVGTPAPTFGQHTREILLEMGCTEDTINRCYADGTVR